MATNGKAELPGFSDVAEDRDSDTSVRNAPKATKKGGGFQCMGLSHPILNAITKRGYKIPTPIQRKAIPIVLQGRDTVAMARTGSGKTACFLIPLLERLRCRTAKTGARALILSPTRELALQTLKFFKDLGRYSDLRAAVILGGDSMDDQFSAVHGKPDVIVATPGRFLHLCIEMDLKLGSIEYVVLDEADRLFEMGLGDQLTDILAFLPSNRQTVLFSATLPKVLVNFAKAGLSDPVLIRLDVESKLPAELQLQFLFCRSEEKVAALLLLLRSVIEERQQVVVFVATKHHVEYLHMLLDKLSISNTYIYSNLDPSARKINSAKFRNGSSRVLLVTDIAARGLDIPHLDNVINFNFPGKPKLFVHRVGRCARAGRSGTAYSVVAGDETAHLLDLQLFLGGDAVSVGTFPKDLLEEQHESVLSLTQKHADLENMERVCDNAYRQYLRSRPTASPNSNRRVKTLDYGSAALHPVFGGGGREAADVRERFLGRIKGYRPNGTVFEICSKNNSAEYKAMKSKRACHGDAIQAFRLDKARRGEAQAESSAATEDRVRLTESDARDVSDTFSSVVLPKKRRIDDLYRTRARDKHYVPYDAPDKHTAEGLEVNTFQTESRHATLDLVTDVVEESGRRPQQGRRHWDRKKKRMVQDDNAGREKRVRTEAGVWIKATYKSDRYERWLSKTKARHDGQDDGDDRRTREAPHTHWARHNRNVTEKAGRSELKSTDQILKARLLAQRKRKRSNGKQKNKKKKGKRK